MKDLACKKGLLRQIFEKFQSFYWAVKRRDFYHTFSVLFCVNGTDACKLPYFEPIIYSFRFMLITVFSEVNIDHVTR